MGKGAKPLCRLAALFAVISVLASCGGAGGGSSQPAGDTPPDNSQEAAVIRLAVRPNPLWNWLKSSGTLPEWERSWNISVVENTLSNHFGVFAGGHADVVIMNAMDVADIVLQSERDAVILGKLTYDRSFLGVHRHSQVTSLEDLLGMKIAVNSSVESTRLWGVLARELYGMDLREGGRDFELEFVNSTVVADLVVRGQVDACICLPDASASFLLSGDLKPLYDGRSAADIYSDEVSDSASALPLDEVFVVDRNWFEANQRSVDFLLSLWEEALNEWKLNKARIITNYPTLFSIEGDEQISWMVGYIDQNDWIVPSVYVGRDDEATNSEIFSRMQEAELVAPNAVNPEFDLSFASEIAALESILKPGESGGGSGSGGDLGRLSDRMSTPGPDDETPETPDQGAGE